MDLISTCEHSGSSASHFQFWGLRFIVFLLLLLLFFFLGSNSPIVFLVFPVTIQYCNYGEITHMCYRENRRKWRTEENERKQRKERENLVEQADVFFSKMSSYKLHRCATI